MVRALAIVALCFGAACSALGDDHGRHGPDAHVRELQGAQPPVDIEGAADRRRALVADGKIRQSLDVTHRRRLDSCSSDAERTGFDCFVGDCANAALTDVDDTEEEMAQTVVDCALEVCALDEDCVAVNAEGTNHYQTSNLAVVSGTGQGPAVCYIKNGGNAMAWNSTLNCDEADGAESARACLGGVVAAVAAWLIA